MHYRRLVLAVVMVLALLLPATATAEAPSGNVYTLLAQLRGDTEVPLGDLDGFGFARIAIDLDAGQICFRLSVARTDTPTASHIHIGDAGVAGPVVVPLVAPVDGLSKGCVDVDAEISAAILANPGGYYVNVHTAEFPPGAVRGQLALLGAQAEVVVPPDGGPTVETVAEGLNSPRGIAVDADGMVYVAQAGVGGDECVMIGEGEEAREACFGGSSSASMIVDGAVEDVIGGLPSFLFSEGEYIGAQDIVLGDDGTVYAVVGLGMDPALREQAGEPAAGLGTIVMGDGAGGWETVVDVAAYEAASNPDGGLIDSNPFSAVMTDDGWAYTDAGANALNWIDADGVISTLAAFPDTMVDAPEFLGLPPGTQIPMQAVPTGLVQGPDGAFYLGQLTGFPFVPDAAKVWRVMPGEDPTVYAEGFTNIIDLAFDADGNLYVLEITAGGLLNVNPEDPATLAGGLYSVGTDGTVEEVLSDGLIAPSGMSFGPDGTLYISNYGLMPGLGEVLSVTWD
ncbi:MAG: ScyD/ScyE family protein [Thermomicrobiales bacterium]